MEESTNIDMREHEEVEVEKYEYESEGLSPQAALAQETSHISDDEDEDEEPDHGLTNAISAKGWFKKPRARYLLGSPGLSPRRAGGFGGLASPTGSAASGYSREELEGDGPDAPDETLPPLFPVEGREWLMGKVSTFVVESMSIRDGILDRIRGHVNEEDYESIKKLLGKISQKIMELEPDVEEASRILPETKSDSMRKQSGSRARSETEDFGGHETLEALVEDRDHWKHTAEAWEGKYHDMAGKHASMIRKHERRKAKSDAGSSVEDRETNIHFQVKDRLIEDLQKELISSRATIQELKDTVRMQRKQLHLEAESSKELSALAADLEAETKRSYYGLDITGQGDDRRTVSDSQVLAEALNEEEQEAVIARSEEKKKLKERLKQLRREIAERDAASIDPLGPHFAILNRETELMAGLEKLLPKRVSPEAEAEVTTPAETDPAQAEPYAEIEDGDRYGKGSEKPDAQPEEDEVERLERLVALEQDNEALRLEVEKLNDQLDEARWESRHEAAPPSPEDETMGQIFDDDLEEAETQSTSTKADGAPAPAGETGARSPPRRATVYSLCFLAIFAMYNIVVYIANQEERKIWLKANRSWTRPYLIGLLERRPRPWWLGLDIDERLVFQPWMGSMGWMSWVGVVMEFIHGWYYPREQLW
ncbi:uncharacterized protein E0L32_008370 [Thyridium curvatum]|uniref:Uncharacterized protein n=1 Tax=Thyridium curvatum TaxID=1093900 RepID=A0A507AV95_9PEZI|nr:uncharacterized protein E0L32_008370 [Thyridium curvatum]TPX10636.1 hypothetical protein E0L32_008370 [Thyridium curvatum]